MEANRTSGLRLSRRTTDRRLPALPPAERLTSAARGGRLRRHRTPNMAAAAQAAHIRSAGGDGTGSRSERERRAAKSRQPWPRR